MLFEELTEKIIGAAFNVYNQMGFGYLEKVYENCMLIELEKINGLDIKHQYPIKVEYKGEDVGDYVVDLLINDSIIVELKSIIHLSAIHEVQLVNYLKTTKLELGLLINFGEKKVEVKRKVRNLKSI